LYSCINDVCVFIANCRSNKLSGGLKDDTQREYINKQLGQTRKELQSLDNYIVLEEDEPTEPKEQNEGEQ